MAVCSQIHINTLCGAERRTVERATWWYVKQPERCKEDLLKNKWPNMNEEIAEGNRSLVQRLQAQKFRYYCKLPNYKCKGDKQMKKIDLELGRE